MLFPILSNKTQVKLLLMCFLFVCRKETKWIEIHENLTNRNKLQKFGRKRV